MSTSKHIDLICIVVLLCTLLITGLFVNGRALGITAVTDGDAAGDSRFTANDLNADWDASNATRITLTGDGGSVKGSGAYLYDGDVYIIYAGEYVLSGELTDGSVIIDAGNDDKIWILLDGVSLHREDSAAIVVEQADKVFLTLADGTENTVSSGASYSEDAISAKIDGAIYSRDDLTVNGGGSLSVTAAYKHGIVCNDNLVITGGTIDITAVRDGVHANDSVSFANASLTVSAGDDGVTVSNDDETAWLYIESGNINITSCYEGLEAIDITIAGGVIDIRPTDDGINANGRGDKSAINITGGDITIINETGRDADGLDSNGSLYISGGNTFISVNTSSYALDYGTENGGVCEISGGTVIAAGGSSMAECFDASSEQCFIMYNTSTAAAGTTVTLKNEAGDILISEAIPCAFSSVVISTPELRMGETCTISIGDTDAEITVDNSSNSNGDRMGGMFGGGKQGGGGMFGGFFGGRGGGESRSDDRWSADSRSTADGQLNISTLSAVDSGRGGMGGSFPGGDMPGDGFPGGDFDDGDMPQMPDGFSDGDAPQIPDGGFPGGVVPQLPDGEPPSGGLPDGEMPQMPSGDLPDGNMWQIPDDFTGGDTDDGFNRGDRFTQWGQDQDWTQDRTPQGGASGSTPAVSPGTFAAVGISVLFLLAGILIAFKIKH